MKKLIFKALAVVAVSVFSNQVEAQSLAGYPISGIPSFEWTGAQTGTLTCYGKMSPCARLVFLPNNRTLILFNTPNCPNCEGTLSKDGPKEAPEAVFYDLDGVESKRQP